MRFLVIAVALVALAGCGFKPMYAPTGGDAAIGAVSIPEIPGKSGHVFRTELEKLLGAERGSATTRRLEVVLKETIGTLGLRVDESSTRADLILTADYVLFDANGGELFRGALRQVASYDIPTSAFGEVSAQNDARERAAAMLAERMRAELALRLNERRNARPAPVLAPTTP